MHNRQKRTLILLIGSIVAIGPLTIDMYLPGFLTIAQHFGVLENQVSYTLTSYFIGISIGQLLYGPILDRFGRKRPLLIGLSIYTVASVLIALSPSLKFFIAMRFIQAVGASSGIVASFAIVRDKFRGADVAKVLSSVILVMGVAPIVAPALGGYFSAHFGWRSIFYFLAGFGATVSLCVQLYLTKVKASDLASVFKFRPILSKYRQTLQNRKFLFYHLAGSFAMGIMFAYISSIASILLTLFAVSQKQFSLLFALNAFAFILGGQANRYLLRKYSPLQISYVAGGFTLFLSILFFVFSANVITTLTVLSIFLVSILFCTGIVNPNATAMSLDSVEKNIGLASALNGSSRMIIGATVSISIGFADSTNVAPMALFFIGLSTFTLLFLRFGSTVKN